MLYEVITPTQPPKCPLTPSPKNMRIALIGVGVLGQAMVEYLRTEAKDTHSIVGIFDERRERTMVEEIAGYSVQKSLAVV